jgi:hypothetical protein
MDTAVMDDAVITFKPHPDAKSRKSSAVALIKFLLKINTPEVLPKHLEKLIDAMLWTITEADGKYNTRHRSDRALRCSDNNMLAHEHVYPKKSMIKRLKSAKSEEEVDQILSLAVGCTVMRDEHVLLHGLDHGDGWERYHKANVGVVNIETGQRVV